jgi:hypothetical protein
MKGEGMTEQPPVPTQVSDQTRAHAQTHQGAHTAHQIRGVRGNVHAPVDNRVITRNTAIGGGVVLAVVLAAVAVWYFRGVAAADTVQRVRDLAADVCAKISVQTDLPPVQPDGTFSTAALVALVEQRADVAEEQASRLERAAVPTALVADVGTAADRLVRLADEQRQSAATLPSVLGDSATLEELSTLGTGADQQRYLQVAASAHDALADVSRTACPPA